MYKVEDLNPFVGKWQTEGRIPSTQDEPEFIVKGTDEYEWLPGGFFLLHKVDVRVGEDRTQTFEIIGLDKAGKYFTMQHYDNKGNSGHMTATHKDNVWTFEGEHLRFTGSFQHDNREISGVWERLDQQSWTHFMDIKLTKES